jgi:phosphoribosylaminoimidazole-succinocarboxamide synthase
MVNNAVPPRVELAAHPLRELLNDEFHARISNVTDALFESTIKSLPLLGRGKVRDIYAVGDDKLLIVTSDRLSAFDVILPDPIPGKGQLLTQLACFWFEKLAAIVPNQMTGIDPESVVADDERAQVRVAARWSSSACGHYRSRPSCAVI